MVQLLFCKGLSRFRWASLVLYVLSYHGLNCVSRSTHECQCLLVRMLLSHSCGVGLWLQHLRLHCMLSLTSMVFPLRSSPSLLGLCLVVYGGLSDADARYVLFLMYVCEGVLNAISFDILLIVDLGAAW